MTWAYEQKFNDLNIGDLAGQDSWVDESGIADSLDVQTSTVFEGTKAVGRIETSDTAETVTYYRDITAITSGIFYISLRYHYATYIAQATVKLNDGASSIFEFFAKGGTTNELSYWTATTGLVKIQDSSNDTWYRIGVEIDASNNRVKVNVNNGTWTDWITIGSFTEIDRIKIMSVNCKTNDATYFDDISPDYGDDAVFIPKIIMS